MKRAGLIAAVLAGLHLLVLLAGFAAPYDPVEQTRTLPFAPPTRLHVVDAGGQVYLRPFTYALRPDPNDVDSYVEDTTERFPVRLFVPGAAYALLPGVESHLHLFGVEAPGRISLLGTDGFGRDVLSRVLHGGRISIGAGLLATLCALVVGVACGTLAGYCGGRVDSALMRGADLFMAIPWLYLLFAVRAMLPLHVDTRTTFLLLVAVLGLVGWARPARLIRGVVLSARERTYVTAARGFGARPPYLLRRHVLPQAFGVVLTQAGLLVPQYILAEVTLSFLGLGVGEPTPSWGAMLGTLQQYAVLTSYWWMFAPAVALVAVAVGYHALTSIAHERMRLVASFAFVALLLGQPAHAATVATGEQVLVERATSGTHGGRLVVALRAEPRSLNPASATDSPSREVIGRMTGDLIHIDRSTHSTEAALASQWKRSADGRDYTLTLRKGIRFSDGHPFDADDVVFTFRALLDERTGAPQRDLLIVGGQPIRVTKIDSHTVRVSLSHPYAAAERIFDSLAILPQHLLGDVYAQGKLAGAWPLSTPASAVAGLGPYRLKEYVAGQRLVLERNPYYWKTDAARQRLPYIDELVFLFTGNEDAQVIRFQSGESDVLSRASADNFAVLARDQASRQYQLKDLGPSLEYNFLFFNQNDLSGKTLPQVSARQQWFADLGFRRAVSRAIDRDGIARLVYRGRAVPLWGNVSPGNRRWLNTSLPRQPRSVSDARAILKASGFAWRPDGALIDRHGRPVSFTIVTSSSSAQRTEMATLIQADLKELGMDVQVVPLEFRALVDRVFQTFDYDASILGLGGGDADPNGEMSVWLSSGSNHLWRLGQKTPATVWEADVDRLMETQLVTLDPAERKRLYDRVQAIVAEQVPFIFLAAPHILVGARADLGNFQPAVLDHYTLWNVERMFFRPELKSAQR